MKKLGQALFLALLAVAAWFFAVRDMFRGRVRANEIKADMKDKIDAIHAQREVEHAATSAAVAVVDAEAAKEKSRDTVDAGNDLIAALRAERDG
jgi:hypothetical protein